MDCITCSCWPNQSVYQLIINAYPYQSSRKILINWYKILLLSLSFFFQFFFLFFLINSEVCMHHKDGLIYMCVYLNKKDLCFKGALPFIGSIFYRMKDNWSFKEETYIQIFFSLGIKTLKKSSFAVNGY